VLSLAAGQQCARAKRDLACAVGELGADYVLDGSVQRQAERIRVTLSLVKGSSRLVSWSQSYDGALDDLFGFQHTVAEGVAGALRLRVPHDPGTHARRLAVGERAFSDYAQALGLLERRDEPASVDRAIALLEEVAAAEPRFALAQAGLGRAHWVKYESTKDVEQARRAEAALGLALRLDPDLPGVLLVQASVLKTKGQLSSAEAAARRALGLQAENDEAHALLGAVLAATGRPEEGLAELRRAIELRPNYWQHHQERGLAELELGRYAAAADSFRRLIELRPGSVWGHVNLGTALLAAGDAAAARSHFEKAVSIQPDADAYSNLGFIAFGEGRYAEAAAAFARAVALQPDDAGLQRNLADAYAKVGRPADARRLYRRAADLQAAQRAVRPDDAGLLARLAVYEGKAGDAGSARAHARPARELGAPSAEVAYFCGVAYALAGDRREAVSAIGRALDLGFSVELVRSDDDLRGVADDPDLAARLGGRAARSHTEEER
jgi:tetratricopeptide (TPR) repeat protein